MKKFNIYYVRKRTFEIITDIFPKLDTLYIIIKQKVSIKYIIREIQQIKQKISIKFSTNFKKIYIMFILRVNLDYILKIKSTITAKIKYIINQNIKIKNKIVSSIYAIIKLSSDIDINIRLSDVMRALLSFAQNNSPFNIKITFGQKFNAVVRRFRKLFNMGYSTQNDDYYYDISLWSIDNNTLFYLDSGSDFWVYWGCQPYNFQALYSLEGFGYDFLQKQGGTWRINKKTQIYLAQDSQVPNYNYIQQQDISFVSQIDQLYKISIQVQDISISQNQILSNIFQTLQQEPSGENEGIYLSNGNIYIYILKQRFQEQPSQEDIYLWLVQNYFKMLTPLYQTEIIVLDNQDVINILNSGQLNIINGKIQYTNNITNQSPENPLIFFGYGEMQFLVTE